MSSIIKLYFHLSYDLPCHPKQALEPSRVGFGDGLSVVFQMGKGTLDFLLAQQSNRFSVFLTLLQVRNNYRSAMCPYCSERATTVQICLRWKKTDLAMAESSSQWKELGSEALPSCGPGLKGEWDPIRTSQDISKLRYLLLAS